MFFFFNSLTGEVSEAAAFVVYQTAVCAVYGRAGVLSDKG